METFYLQIEVQKEQAELAEGQSEGIYGLEFDTKEEVIQAGESMCKWLYPKKKAKAYLIINKHSAKGNLPCTPELIYEQ